MLRLMRDDPAHSDVARQIHAGAVQWYTNGRDPTLSAEAAGREAFYHSLMLETGEESLLGRTPVGPSGLKDQRWMRLAQELGEAVDELPPKVAAQVRVLRGDRIEDRDATLLPEPIWQQWAARHGLELVGAGQAAAALALFDARQAVRPVRAEPEWLAQAYSDTARWGEYWHTVHEIDVLAPFPDRTELSSGRYALLNAFLSPPIDDFFDYERALREYFELRGTDSAPAAAFERLFLHLLCTFAIPVGRLYRPQRHWEAPPVAAEMLTQSGRRGREQGVIDIYPVDQLRRVMVWIGARSGAQTFGIEQPAALFRPDPQWMRDFAWFVGADPGKVNAYFRSLEGAADELRSHDLLGEWSLSYSRRLAPSEVIVLERSHIRRVARSMAVLRGDNPEFRPAIVLALQSVVSGQDDVGELGRIAWPLLPIQPADLDPSAIQRTGQRALVQLVEYVDRSGVMGEFLAGVRDARPGSALIGEVSRAFARWDAVHRQLLNVLAEDVLRP